jgi:6,7-dimethyl-8-ribityllumazine synthase
MSSDAPKSSALDLPRSARIAVVAARWNASIVDVLLSDCVERLKQIGLDETRISVHRVPGAFELPVAAKMLVDTGRFNAVILLGCVIRGETAHFEYVAGGAARGIQDVATATGIPCIFGVLATENLAQAQARAGGEHGHAGIAAADAAAEMIALAHSLKQ